MECDSSDLIWSRTQVGSNALRNPVQTGHSVIIFPNEGPSGDGTGGTGSGSALRLEGTP